MSRTRKEGKRRRLPKGKSESEGVAKAKKQRHVFGSTEKIRRRNRKTWTRLANKRRRAVDKKATSPLMDVINAAAKRYDRRPLSKKTIQILDTPRECPTCGSTSCPAAVEGRGGCYNVPA